VLLVESLSAPGLRSVWRRAVWLVLVLLLATRLPRVEATTRFHGGRDMPPLFRFSSIETEALADAIAREGNSALVEADDAPHFPVFLMVELGRRGVGLQWSERAWTYIVGYRRWPRPIYSAPAPLRIVLRDKAGPGVTPILRTTQFDLVRRGVSAGG
jgi:hypothetical protein